mmetsp:Transcript_57484/g.132012  ORF Transcript_57484/g.132012 Transcript_57484/m.132012 type:complete len:201 (-) Transcript_57484:264-866(-)
MKEARVTRQSASALCSGPSGFRLKRNRYSSSLRGGFSVLLPRFRRRRTLCRSSRRSAARAAASASGRELERCFPPAASSFLPRLSGSPAPFLSSHDTPCKSANAGLAAALAAAAAERDSPRVRFATRGGTVWGSHRLGLLSSTSSFALASCRITGDAAVHAVHRDGGSGTPGGASEFVAGTITVGAASAMQMRRLTLRRR